ncbi:hypothetical protein [Arenibacter algicola]|uniref:hypothetical protein n=1 Tax=Arenibacter algicola TaxID=616991 RepID=UPI001C0709FB|nr:hypothetical protein [Arenibacter algicola]
MLGALIFAEQQTYGQQEDSLMSKLALSINKLASMAKTNSIYLQTNKDIYEHDEDFWFKSWVLDSQAHQISTLDKTLYITLTKASNDSIVFQEKYKIENGTTSGHVYIENSWPKGEYWLSAYSAHSIYDNGQPFYDRRKIHIISHIGDATGKAFPKNDNQSNIRTQFNVFPEGGQLIEGLRNTIAFKAVSPNGYPVKIKGTLYESGKTLLPFESIHDGMGKLSFVPQVNQKYTIGLENQPDTVYILPNPKKQGIRFYLEAQTENELVFNVAKTPISLEQKIYLRIQTRGMVQFIASGMLKDSLLIKIPLKQIPQGIVEATLFDNELRPLVERLVYVNLDKGMNIIVTGLEKLYATRKMVKLKIKTTDSDNNSVPAQLSLSVFDKIYERLGKKNILTHYYLSTQLKGNIHNPDYYFDKSNKDRSDALDLLMLTQGWRKYTWDDESIQKRAEAKNVVLPVETGTLRQLKIGKDHRPQRTMVLFNPDNNTSQILELDDNGTFKLDESSFTMGRRLFLKHFPIDNDEYRVDLGNTFDKIKIALTGKVKPYPIFENKDSIPQFDSLTTPWQEQGTITLEEVKVSARKKSVFRDKYLGQLDSLAKLDINTDYVCISGILNCEIHVRDPDNQKPVEGKVYQSYVGFQWNSNKTEYTIRGRITQKYEYPIFTEEELLRKNNLTKVQGFYGKKEFYSPVYDKETIKDPLPDYRNTLLWAPSIVTDEKGEATVTFFCSDLNTQFIGIIEGVGGEGLLGHHDFEFFVSKN